MCHNQVEQPKTQAATTSGMATAKSTPAAPTTELPAFEDFAIIASVALFHWAVCLGFRAAALLAPVLLELLQLTARVAMGLCAVARRVQQHQATLPQWDPKMKNLPRAAITKTTTKWTTTNINTATTATTTTGTSTSAKASPALPGTITRGATECVLWWSSLNVNPEERSAIDRARQILHDALVVFDEIDAASLEEGEFDAMLDSTGAPAGEYPLVFVWTPRTRTRTTRTQTATSTATATTEATKATSMTMTLSETLTKIKTETTASTPRTPRVHCLSMEKLTTAEFYADVPLSELARVGAVSDSALFLFQDVSTLRQRSHTFDAQLHALGDFVMLHDETFFEKLHAPWHVPVDNF